MVSGGGEQSAVGITRGGGRTSTHGGVKGLAVGLSLRISEIDFAVHFRFELWGPKFLLLRG